MVQPRWPGWEATTPAYEVHHEWLTGSLVTGESLLDPDRKVWTAERLDELTGCFVESPDFTSKMVFIDKLHRQLEDVSDDAVILMAELHIVHFLMIHKLAIGAAKKAKDVETILGWRDIGVETPKRVLDAFEVGIAHPGQWALTYRNIQLSFLIAFASRAIERDDWLEVANDPWKLRDFVRETATPESDDAARLSLLHLAHPHVFEPIVQPKHAAAIVERYRGSLDNVEDIDRELLAIRDELTPAFGEGFDWYFEPAFRTWNRDPKRWAEFCGWIADLRALPEFEEHERFYKLDVVDDLERARRAVIADDPEWPTLTKRAIRASNLVATMTKTRMADWIEDDPVQCRQTLLTIWGTTATPARERIADLEDTRPEDQLTTPGERLSLASVLLMTDGAEDHAPLKISVLRRAWALTGWGEPDGISVPETYDRAMLFFDEVRHSVPTLQDRLDAQGAVWALVKLKQRPNSWDEKKWDRFEAFRSAKATDPDGAFKQEEHEDYDAVSETQRRQLRYEAIREAWAADEDAQRAFASAVEKLEGSRLLAEHLLEELGQSHDLAIFRSRVANSSDFPQQLNRGAHPNFLAHAVNKAGDSVDAIAGVVASTYRAPTDTEAAAAQISQLHSAYRRLTDVAESYVGMAPLAASVYWSLQDHERWPPLWASVEEVLTRLGWHSVPADPADRYQSYREALASLDDRPFQAVHALQWFANGGIAGVDPTAIARCRENQRLAELFYEDDRGYPDQVSQTTADLNARSLIGDFRYLAEGLERLVEEAVGGTVSEALPRPRYGTDLPYRHDAFAGWRLTELPSSPTVRVWATVDGIYLGLHPGWLDTGWYVDAAERVRPHLGSDLEFFRLRSGRASYVFESTGGELPGGEFIVGRLLDTEQACSPAIADIVTDGCRSLQPIIAALHQDRASQDVAPDELEIGGDFDHLYAAARDLLVDRSELDRLTALLEDKGQIVLYGPPGTGKTFLAKRLARALAGDRRDRWAVVQFHPATTYEDFIEGLRPTVVDGQVHYTLQAGPLISMALAAAADPSGTYVLVVDEVNRANLPKVLGELLFLLEYREEPVRLLYRPDEPFTLPRNLWFVGTMNTADRSIALIDAAMRRRFHFVGLFPNHGPMEGLLARWLAEHGRPAHVAQFVDAVNAELAVKLGEHLLLGPSFFMKNDLSLTALEGIWQHNVFPFLEEQFWGSAGDIEHWRWPAVKQRFSKELGVVPPTEIDEQLDVDESTDI